MSPVAEHVTVKSTDVLCIGHPLIDIIAPCDDALLERLSLDKGIMSLVDDRRAHEIYEQMGPGQEASGGSAANTSVGVATTGGRAEFVGLVANDELGKIFQHDLHAAGVHYDIAPDSGGRPTGRSMVLVSPDHHRTMCTNLGVAQELTPEHLSLKALEKARIVAFEGYLFDNDKIGGYLYELSQRVQMSGGMACLFLSDPYCADRHREAFLRLLDGPVDAVVGNEAEFASLYEVNDRHSAFDRAAASVSVVAMTMSEHGAWVCRDGERVVLSAKTVPVVDTTGAGDQFAAGFLAGIARGADLAEAGQLGIDLASEVIQHLGAR